jgi:hypothetical protein
MATKVKIGQKRKMIMIAMKQYGAIYPCPKDAESGKRNKRGFLGCFNIFDNHAVFWFNTEDHSTHTIVSNLED